MKDMKGLGLGLSLSLRLKPNENTRLFLGGIDVNEGPSMANFKEENGVSSSNSTVLSLSRKISENEPIVDKHEGERTSCSYDGGSDDEDGNDSDMSRKKLMLSKEQSLLLDETFKEHNTLNPKQKQELAKQLNLRPRQVEVWFQNRRASFLVVPPMLYTPPSSFSSPRVFRVFRGIFWGFPSWIIPSPSSDESPYAAGSAASLIRPPPDHHRTFLQSFISSSTATAIIFKKLLIPTSIAPAESAKSVQIFRDQQTQLTKDELLSEWTQLVERFFIHPAGLKPISALLAFTSLEEE
ncbi:hypothetical protein TB2_033761 [Malus domestica]